MKLKEFALLASIICTAVFLPISASADRKIRIHFVAASFSYAEDKATNTKLVAGWGAAGYDAVWEASVPDGFPTAFGSPVQISGSGQAKLRTEDSLQNCDGELKFHETGTHPSVSIYNIDGDKYALQIVAPHGAILEDRANDLCRDPFFVISAPGEGVTSTPPYSGIPNFPGTSSPPAIESFAAFIVDADKPDTTINFSYEQTTNFPQLAYTSKSVWFGFVNVELNPRGQRPGSIDPLRLFNYSPPGPFESPPNPPAPNNGGGEPTITISDIKKWITDPVINDIKSILDTLQQIWNSVTGQSRSIKTRAFVDPSNRFSYDPATRQLTIFNIDAAPADGAVSVKIGIGDKGQKSAAKSVSVSGSGSQNLILTLPSAVESALNKGKKFSVKVTGNYVSSSDKKKKATVTKKFSVKKRQQ